MCIQTEIQQQNENMDPNAGAVDLSTQSESPKKKINKQRSHFCEYRFIDPLFFPSDRVTSIKLQLSGMHINICIAVII